ncbi:MAG TPA: hypothetical protein PLA50_04100 [Bacteroidia bacterium]|nr:hypothetical protein [Bacteroidia bacterium]
MRLLIASFAIVFAVLPVLGQSPDERDWLESYYENPTPERLVPQMKEWAADGTLANPHAKPALIAFLSQVIRQNRERLGEWYRELSGLTPEQMQVMHTAMLYSRTKEADDLMREKFGRRYDEQKLETKKILEMPLDKEGAMDMLWGFYYATGSEEAVRRIVTAFRFRDAPDKPPGVDVPDGYVPLYKALPQFAHDALVSNARRHPRLVEILRKMLASDKTLLDMEREGVQSVLDEIDPSAYPPKPSGTKTA